MDIRVSPAMLTDNALPASDQDNDYDTVPDDTQDSSYYYPPLTNGNAECRSHILRAHLPTNA